MEPFEEFEQQSPIRKVSILARINLNHLTDSFSDIGVARGSIAFLMEVLRGENVIQEDMTRSLSIDRAATARAIQTLERDGFVTRCDDPDDKRRKRVEATSKTDALEGEILTILQTHKDILFSGFSEEEASQFLTSLDRMIDNMQSHLTKGKDPQG